MFSRRVGDAPQLHRLVVAVDEPQRPGRPTGATVRPIAMQTSAREEPMLQCSDEAAAPQHDAAILMPESPWRRPRAAGSSFLTAFETECRTVAAPALRGAGTVALGRLGAGVFELTCVFYDHCTETSWSHPPSPGKRPSAD